MYDEAFAFSEQLLWRYTHDVSWVQFYYALVKRSMELQDIDEDKTEATASILKTVCESLIKGNLYYATKETTDLIVAGQRSMRKVLDPAVVSNWIDGRYVSPATPIISYWEKATVPGPGLLYFPRGVGPTFHFGIPDGETTKIIFTNAPISGVKSERCDAHEGRCGSGRTVGVQWTHLNGFIDGTENDKWIAVIMYADIPDLNLYGVPCGVYAWGERLDHAIHYASGHLDFDSSTFLSSFWAFVQQRVLVTESHIPPKAFRKRAASACRKIAPLQVVHLRRAEYIHASAGANDTPRDVEWKSRWMVDAHWHRYHTNDGMIRKWVLPYVKGPDDKPLVIPEKKVFAVVR